MKIKRQHAYRIVIILTVFASIGAAFTYGVKHIPWGSKPPEAPKPQTAEYVSGTITEQDLKECLLTVEWQDGQCTLHWLVPAKKPNDDLSDSLLPLGPVTYVRGESDQPFARCEPEGPVDTEGKTSRWRLMACAAKEKTTDGHPEAAIVRLEFYKKGVRVHWIRPPSGKQIEELSGRLWGIARAAELNPPYFGSWLPLKKGSCSAVYTFGSNWPEPSK
jgi:hypothetical protein